MKNLVTDIGLDNLHEEMKVFRMEATSTSIVTCTTFVTYPKFVLPLKLQ
jgi:hypothetical protein